jgi:hypothetical protein
MDKLKRALTGREEPDDEERGFVAQVWPPSFISSVSDGVPDPDLGPPGSASESVSHKYGSGYGSFPFLIKVLSGLKQWLKNKI